MSIFLLLKKLWNTLRHEKKDIAAVLMTLIQWRSVVPSKYLLFNSKSIIDFYKVTILLPISLVVSFSMQVWMQILVVLYTIMGIHLSLNTPQMFPIRLRYKLIADQYITANWFWIYKLLFSGRFEWMYCPGRLSSAPFLRCF